MAKNEDRSARGGQARYGHGGQATGSNEPKHPERKERSPDWVHRQGGDQTRKPAHNEDRDERG
jgi:general stress protein YciG